MIKSKITNLNIFGITPETENNIPSQITDLDDGSNIIDSIASLENNKQNNLSSEQLEAVNSGITAGKIMQSPYTTSEINPLVNQEFVNSSIATNTANFIGTFSNIVDLENYSGTLTNNDYAFVTNKVINNGNPFNTFNDMISYVTPIISYVVNYDYAFVINTNDNTKIDVYRYDISQSTIAERWGENSPVATAIDINDFQKNPAYNRYKYNGNTWEFEYTLNNSSFTASQWAAINSGITSELVSKIGSSTLVGTTDPTTATVGEVGQFYLNTTTNKLFQCQSAGGGSYTWEVPNVNAITLGTETQTFAGGKTLLFPTSGYNLTLAPASSTSTNVKIYPSAIHATYGQHVVKVSANNEDAHIAFKQMSSDPDLVLTGRALGSKKTITLPNKTGTVALTSDIPTIPTLDTTPTQNSQNAVTSGGVYSAIQSFVPNGINYLTTAPVADNTDGDLKIVVLSSEPATKYNGYLYIWEN